MIGGTNMSNIRLSKEELYDLILAKLSKAGLDLASAEETSKHLVFANLSGIHSHGAVRVEYYAERISKGGVTINPKVYFEKTGPSTGIFHGDNGQGHYIANMASDKAIGMAKESGVAVVGVKCLSHSGTMSYYVDKIARHNLIGISMCQSDPMVVPFGGAEVYFGTNPIGFSAPRLEKDPIVFDMATSVQAWGKILDARSKNETIPEDWAVDSDGQATTDPHKVAGLLPISGPKGYGLMMMVDILSGMMLGLPFGKHVSSMYEDLSSGRNLGHLFIVIDPSRFTDIYEFKNNVETMVNELHDIKARDEGASVYYPGEVSKNTYYKSVEEGIDIPKSIVNYLKSNDIHYDQYGHSGIFN